MVKDVVCGMMVDESKAAKSEYQGKTYYFCCPPCKASFDKDPGKYVGGQAGAAHMGHGGHGGHGGGHCC